MRASVFLRAALLAIASMASVSAGDAQAPVGPVVLTVAGKVANTNRPAYDERRDVFFAYHERGFDDAFSFDLATLDSLGQKEVHIEYENWPEPMSPSGPLLEDVLETAGCAPGPLSTLALDGYATTITGEKRRAHEWIVATRANGRRLAIGGRGPLWLVYDPPGDRPALTEESENWPWAVFFIRCL